MNPDDVRRFHEELGREYLAYAYPADPAVYPTGAKRTQATASAMHGQLGAAPGRAVDLGCGRGDLCFLLAASGTDVVGVDFSETMLAEAGKARASLPAAVAARVTFTRRDCFDNGLDAGVADAVAAVGVIETEESDTRLLNEARRLLRPGGVLALSCRNRLFNLVSTNRHTRRELESGGLARLLDEAERWLATAGSTGTSRAIEAFLGHLDQLRPAIASTSAPSAAAAPAAVRIGDTRQHTPMEIVSAAAAAGFGEPRFIGVHPHPLPAAMEALAPALYNQLVTASEAFEREPLALIWSSAFVVALTRQ